MSTGHFCKTYIHPLTETNFYKLVLSGIYLLAVGALYMLEYRSPADKSSSSVKNQKSRTIISTYQQLQQLKNKTTQRPFIGCVWPIGHQQFVVPPLKGQCLLHSESPPPQYHNQLKRHKTKTNQDRYYRAEYEKDFLPKSKCAQLWRALLLNKALVMISQQI